MDKTELIEAVRGIIFAMKPEMVAAGVDQDASLTNELGLDSIQLEEFISAVKSQVASINFTPWCIRANQWGGDTIASLVSYIDDQSVLGANLASRTE